MLHNADGVKVPGRAIRRDDFGRNLVSAQDLLVAGRRKSCEKLLHIGGRIRDDLMNAMWCRQIFVNPARYVNFHFPGKKSQSEPCIEK